MTQFGGKLALVHSLVLPPHTQAQQRQPQSGHHFVALNKLPQAQSQAALDIDPHQSPSQEAPEPTHPGASFRLHENRLFREQGSYSIPGVSTKPCRGKCRVVWSAHAQRLLNCHRGQPPQSASLRGELTYKQANNNQHSNTTGRLT